MRVEWTQRALRTLDAIGDYIAKDNPKRAITFTHELFRQVDRWGRVPQMGRPGERPDVREFVVHRNYLVSYRLGPDKVEILDIWHSARQRSL